MSASFLEIGPDAVQSPNALHLGIVGAWMVFPDDAHMRDRAIRTAAAEHGLELLDAGELPTKIRGLVSLALHAPSPDDLHEQSKERIRRGFAAGMILYNVCIRATRGELAPMARAIKEIDHAVSRSKAGTSHHVNDAIWKKFRPVAALWAAHILISNEHGDPTEFPCNRGDLPLFLRFAESMQTIAEGTRLPHRKAGLLKRCECVLIPDGLLALLPKGTLLIPDHPNRSG